MHNEKNIMFFAIMRKLKVIHWRRLLNGARPLSSWLTRQLAVVRGRYTFELAVTAFSISRKVIRITRNSGALHCALYLKACALLLKRAIAGGLPPHYAPSSKLPLVSLTPNGLPRIILAHHRKFILVGDTRGQVLVQMYLTIFSLYKIIKFERVKMDLTSIEKPFEPLKNGLSIAFKFLDGKLSPGDLSLELPMRYILEIFSRSAAYLVKLVPDILRLPFYPVYETALSWSSSPLSGVSSLRALFLEQEHDPEAIPESLQGRVYFSLYREFILPILGGLKLKKTDEGKHFTYLSYAEPKPPILRFGKDNAGNVREYTVQPAGKLGAVVEAAGKVRIFAILSPHRQARLRAYHEWASEISRRIITDGTFDQLRPLNLLFKRQTRRPDFYSYDLSAATDRFPFLCYILLVSQLTNRQIALLWVHTINRLSFEVPSSRLFPPWWRRVKGSAPKQISFATGQPLGALSSFPLFALCHHVIIQYCADQVALHLPFLDYALLGDDVVISHPQVAKVYLRVMETLGVEISPTKSIVSNNRSAEFASRFIYRGNDVSPLPFGLLFAAKQVLGTCVKPLIERLNRNFSVMDVVRILGAGYVSRSRFRVGVYPFRGRCSHTIRRQLIHILSPKGTHPLPLPYWLTMFWTPDRWMREWPNLYLKIGYWKEILRSRLYRRLFESDWTPEPPDYKEVDEMTMEIFIIQPWFSLKLDIIRRLSLGLIQGVDVWELYLESVEVARTLDRPSTNQRHLGNGQVVWSWLLFQRCVLCQPNGVLPRATSEMGSSGIREI